MIVQYTLRNGTIIINSDGTEPPIYEGIILVRDKYFRGLLYKTKVNDEQFLVAFTEKKIIIDEDYLGQTRTYIINRTTLEGNLKIDYDDPLPRIILSAKSAKSYLKESSEL